MRASFGLPSVAAEDSGEAEKWKKRAIQVRGPGLTRRRGRDFCVGVSIGCLLRQPIAGLNLLPARPRAPCPCPCAQVRFEIPYFTVSGIQVRYLKVIEKSGYAALPWVRYITQNGDYQLRMGGS